jgi:hypothetical protein
MLQNSALIQRRTVTITPDGMGAIFIVPDLLRESKKPVPLCIC